MSIVGLLVPLLLGMGSWPVTPVTVIQDYDPPLHAWSSGHRGIDLDAQGGEPVRAVSAGTVSFVGTIAGKPVVSIGHGGSLRSTYEPVVGTVRVGEQVEAGDLIGSVAAAGGHCGGTCVHVGLKDDSGYLDPRSVIDRRPAVLKPIRR